MVSSQNKNPLLNAFAKRCELAKVCFAFAFSSGFFNVPTAFIVVGILTY